MIYDLHTFLWERTPWFASQTIFCMDVLYRLYLLLRVNDGMPQLQNCSFMMTTIGNNLKSRANFIKMTGAPVIGISRRLSESSLSLAIFVLHKSIFYTHIAYLPSSPYEPFRKTAQIWVSVYKNVDELIFLTERFLNIFLLKCLFGTNYLHFLLRWKILRFFSKYDLLSYKVSKIL